MTKKSFRFWLIYSVAWLPYAASYAAVFVSHLGSSFVTAVKDALFNIVPAAMLGVAVVGLCRSFQWSREKRIRFVAIHVVLALLYAAAWISAVPLLFALEGEVKSGHWTYLRFQGYALQWQFFAGLMIYGTVAGITYAVHTAEQLRAEEARARQAENLRTRAELEALRARLNPHFLFNTLHSVMAVVRNDPPAAERALERLAGLLRQLLTTKVDENEDVLVSDELKFVDNYLALEQLRLGNRLRIESNIQPETLDCALPLFTLQPLVENSLKHAFSKSSRAGVLRINSYLDASVLHLEVSDDGPGATLEQVRGSKGLGLRIAQQRIQTRYGGRARFVVNTEPGRGFVVCLELPLDIT